MGNDGVFLSWFAVDLISQKNKERRMLPQEKRNHRP